MLQTNYCQKVEEQFSDYHHGTLNRESADIVFSHMMSCDACYQRFWLPSFSTVKSVKEALIQAFSMGRPEDQPDQQSSRPNLRLLSFKRVEAASDWTIHAEQKLAAAGAGVIGQAHGRIRIDEQTFMEVRVHCRRGPDTSYDEFVPPLQITWPRCFSSVSEDGEAHILRALEEIGCIVPASGLELSIDLPIEPIDAQSKLNPQDSSLELPLAVAAASCLLQMPVSGDVIFCGALDERGQVVSLSEGYEQRMGLRDDVRFVLPWYNTLQADPSSESIAGCTALAKALDCAGTEFPGRPVVPSAPFASEAEGYVRTEIFPALPGQFIVLPTPAGFSPHLEAATPDSRPDCQYLLIGGWTGMLRVQLPGVTDGSSEFIGGNDGTTVTDATSQLRRLLQKVRGRVRAGLEQWIEKNEAQLLSVWTLPESWFAGATTSRRPLNARTIQRAFAKSVNMPQTYLPMPMVLELAAALASLDPEVFPRPSFSVGSSSPGINARSFLQVVGSDTTIRAEQRRQLPCLEHFGTLLPRVPWPDLLDGYHVDLNGSRQVAPYLFDAIARIHVQLDEQQREQVQLEPVSDRLRLDGSFVATNETLPLSRRHRIQQQGVAYEYRSLEAIDNLRQRFVGMLIHGGPIDTIGSQGARIGRSRKASIRLPDRKIDSNLHFRESRQPALDPQAVPERYLDNAEVSGEHAQLRLEGNQIWLEALKSYPVYVYRRHDTTAVSDGDTPQVLTTVLGDAPIPLRHNDWAFIGHQIFRVLMEESLS